jgi:septal ring factor EnvC (AmiA/AmiB activator)
MGTLIGLTEGERLGVLSALAVVLAASIPACIAAWSSLRTRKENTEQHGESQQLLRDLASDVRGHGDKLDDLKDDIGTLAQRVDNAHERIDRHIDDLNDRHGYGPGL